MLHQSSSSVDDSFGRETIAGIPAEILERMKGLVANLEVSLDGLGQQTVRCMTQLGGEKTEHNAASLRNDILAQERRQREDLDELQALAKEVIEHELIDHLRSLVESDVMEMIEALVEEEVARYLVPEYIPQDLQDELRQHRKQLEDVQRALHDSESRRANATLRSNREPLERIHTVFNSQGEIPSNFPRTLFNLFTMSSDTASSLVREYGLAELSSREGNINRLSQHFGIQYQITEVAGTRKRGQ
ncbi:hypothetical protein C8Q74DRAFT_1236331 [Fomes fomentarius]|nr:hypothetical protein C8Q74DRAFT_1236331 [Fomes fomentarius]